MHRCSIANSPIVCQRNSSVPVASIVQNTHDVHLPSNTSDAFSVSFHRHDLLTIAKVPETKSAHTNIAMDYLQRIINKKRTKKTKQQPQNQHCAIFVCSNSSFSVYSPTMSTTRNVSMIGSMTSSGIRVSLLFWMFNVSSEFKFSNADAGNTDILKIKCDKK